MCVYMLAHFYQLFHSFAQAATVIINCIFLAVVSKLQLTVWPAIKKSFLWVFVVFGGAGDQTQCSARAGMCSYH